MTIKWFVFNQQEVLGQLWSTPVAEVVKGLSRICKLNAKWLILSLVCDSIAVRMLSAVHLKHALTAIEF